MPRTESSRATCPICGQDQAIRMTGPDAGTMRAHGRPQCEGTGQRPAAQAEPEAALLEASTATESAPEPEPAPLDSYREGDRVVVASGPNAGRLGNVSTVGRSSITGGPCVEVDWDGGAVAVYTLGQEAAIRPALTEVAAPPSEVEVGPLVTPKAAPQFVEATPTEVQELRRQLAAERDLTESAHRREEAAKLRAHQAEEALSAALDLIRYLRTTRLP